MGIALAAAFTFVTAWVIVAVARVLIAFAMGVYYGATLPDNELLLWLYAAPSEVANTEIALLVTGLIWSGLWLWLG